MDYRELNTALFRAAERAICAIEAQNFGQAKEILIEAEQNAEEQYLRCSESENAM